MFRNPIFRVAMIADIRPCAKRIGWKLSCYLKAWHGKASFSNIEHEFSLKFSIIEFGGDAW